MKAMVVGIVVAIALVFFLAPMMLWYTAYSPVVSYACSAGNSTCQSPAPQPIYSEYRSLGCMVLGMGDSILVGGYDMPQFQLNCYAPPMPQ